MAKKIYDNDYPSCTQVLDVLRKIGLENWFKYTPLEQINEESKRGREAGTDIHAAIHTYIATGETKIETRYPNEVTNALKSFMLFHKENPQYKFKNSEITLTSEIHKINGTTDVLIEDEDVLMLGDWKGGKAKKEDKPPIYDEYKTQISCYVNLYNEVFKANISRAIIIALAKDKVAYNSLVLEKEELDAEFNEVFLPALRIWYFKNRKDKK